MICYTRKTRFLGYVSVMSIAVTVYFVVQELCIITNQYKARDILCLENLDRYNPDQPALDPATCPVIEEHHDSKLDIKNTKFPIPICQNIVKRIVNGHWKEDTLKTADVLQNVILDEIMVNIRTHQEGFTKFPFREDGKCGYQVLHQDLCTPMFWRMTDASAWCDPTSDRPCCSHHRSGVCVAESNCTSPESVNLARYLHAELSQWVTDDKSCKTAKYEHASACALLLDRNVSSIGFVGNSLMQNMYSTMLQLLSNNYYNGSIGSCTRPSIRNRCVNHLQIMDKYCLLDGLAKGSERLPPPGLCGGQIETRVYWKAIWNSHMGAELLEFARQHSGDRNSYLLIGIGIHDGYDAAKVTRNYLKPTFDFLKSRRFPRIMWVHPLKMGVFKPPYYTKLHGDDARLSKFVADVDRFCAEYGVPTLDIRSLSTGVWSVDGTHYGVGVNRQKLQFLFNVLAAADSVWPA